MTYKQWILNIKQEWNGIAVDYTDPEGKEYSEPFCFFTIEEAQSYGQMCIDRLIQSRAKSQTQAAV